MTRLSGWLLLCMVRLQTFPPKGIYNLLPTVSGNGTHPYADPWHQKGSGNLRTSGNMVGIWRSRHVDVLH